MCGIAGWVDWEQDLRRQAAVLEAMGATLACRGPDDSGLWLSPHAALAHRRLVVVDPEAGVQPMLRERGGARYVLTYNGELYNTAELRAELEARGHRFRGHSDTEALLAAYVEWGERCVERLNGIFAFGVWDEREELLFLARDPLGVKPLFYARRGRGLLFGSEIKALLAHPAVEAEIDEEGLAEVFVMGPGRTPGHGVFRGVEELRPGSWLRFARKGTELRRYWRLESRPHTDPVETTAAAVRDLLQDAVVRQLVADVPLGVLLSGGLDSSSVTAFASEAFRRQGRGRLATFSVDYAGNERYFRPNAFQPEADGPWAHRVARSFATDHRDVLIDGGELAEALLPALLGRDMPGMADIDASLYLLSREVRREVTVVLVGEAADELFGGYPWFRDPKALDGPSLPWVRKIAERAELLAPDVRRRIRPLEYAVERFREALAEVPALPGEGEEEARMRALSYVNLTRFLPVLLDRMDRMSMRVGLEVRVPFCDHRLVQYVWNIPWRLKTAGGREKGILRLAMRGILPEEVLARKKSPYPKSHHPDFRRQVRRRLAAILEDPASPLAPLLDAGRVRDLIAGDARDFDPAWFSQLMGGAQLFAYLVQADAWLRLYKVRIA
ncbi:MAG: asparagine synthase (glutamine-hydrolyzing) [Bacillota bacterium]|nr:asparagine synthase (glutamine-hydrolyzing) [Bacillota bacterium]